MLDFCDSGVTFRILLIRERTFCDSDDLGEDFDDSGSDFYDSDDFG